MTRPPFLSIVTISYNQSAYLERALVSVLKQKTSDIEYIVVDPGSTDGSRDIIARYAKEIDHVLLEPDNGPADGLNNAFMLAGGRYGYFLNSDDFMLPGAISRMRAAWDRNASLDVLLGGAWLVDGQDVPLRELRPTRISPSALRDGCVSLVQQGMSFRLDFFRRIGGFNVQNRTCWDYELLCRMVQEGAKIRTISDRLGAFRIYGGSLTGGVGGPEHQARYARDLDRIRRSFGPVSDGPLDRARVRIKWFAKHATHLRNTLSTVRDMVHPSGMRARYAREAETFELDSPHAHV